MKPVAIVAGIIAFVVAVPVIIVAAVAGAILPTAANSINCTGPVAAVAGSWRPPLVSGYSATSGFGMRYHPVLHTTKLHTGIDLVAAGPTKTVVAAAGGTVTTSGFNTAYGNQVVIDHGGGIGTRYAHMAAEPEVRDGQRVQVGTELGQQGATGYVTGAHLHFEVIKNGSPIDPKPFMANQGAPLNGRPVQTTAAAADLPADTAVEGGIGFALPKPGTPRQQSLTTDAAPIPTNIKGLYVTAAAKYKLPWTLLAGIGMAETRHGATKATSSAGAQGLMQFMPATFATMGVDGDGDGRADIDNDADSIFSAANYLTKSGVSKGEEGVRDALFAYNHATTYVNDVLTYAHDYGGGLVLGGVENCGPGTGSGNTNLAALSHDRSGRVLSWATSHIGDAYVFGATGPNAWDCSSFVQAAFKQVGITMPRTAGAQRDWLAAGNGHKVKPGTERPGDLIFWDSFLGPNQIGHVVIVDDPVNNRTIDARNTGKGVGRFTYTAKGKHIFEIWRVSNVE